MRGLAIVLMAVDHAREYSAGTGVLTDPMQLDAVTPLLFWMRWAAHFCAPVFTLLAGVSVGLMSARTSRSGLARYVATRGAVLIALEFTVIHFAWTFSTIWPMRYAQVIWGIGVSMLLLGASLFVPPRARLMIGVACVCGHNLLDAWHPLSPSALHWLWAVLHDRQVLPLCCGISVRTSYPVLPMIGLVLLGEAVGRWYLRTPDSAVRARALTRAGICALAMFVVLRVSNVYGDPHVAVYVGSVGKRLMALLNVTKYPMSLSFMLMTIGPALLVLARWDTAVPRRAAPLTTLGQVPMFLYIAHLYALHAIAILWALARGFPWSSFDFATQIGGIPRGFGFPLWVTIPFALATVGGLYPAARWYQRVRQTKRYPITRYL